MRTLLLVLLLSLSFALKGFAQGSDAVSCRAALGGSSAAPMSDDAMAQLMDLETGASNLQKLAVEKRSEHLPAVIALVEEVGQMISFSLDSNRVDEAELEKFKLVIADLESLVLGTKEVAAPADENFSSTAEIEQQVSAIREGKSITIQTDRGPSIEVFFSDSIVKEYFKIKSRHLGDGKMFLEALKRGPMSHVGTKGYKSLVIDKNLIEVKSHINSHLFGYFHKNELYLVSWSNTGNHGNGILIAAAIGKARDARIAHVGR